MKNGMTSQRLEAFSDGVLAIIITIMVLELEPPEEYTLAAIIDILPLFISYIVSFLYISIYWVSHHELFKIAEKINNKVLWANLNVLFWLSVIPFTTDWIGDGNHHTDRVPILLYGFVLLFSYLSFLYLRRCIATFHGMSSHVGMRLSKNKSDNIFLLIYIIGLFLALFNAYLAMTCFLLVGILKVFALNANTKNKSLA
jgi:uncharacterized membrane protein